MVRRLTPPRAGPPRIPEPVSPLIADFCERLAEEPLFGGEPTAALLDIADQCREPLRVAVAGDVSTGKSTLVARCSDTPTSTAARSTGTSLVIGHPEELACLLRVRGRDLDFPVGRRDPDREVPAGRPDDLRQHPDRHGEDAAAARQDHQHVPGPESARPWPARHDVGADPRDTGEAIAHGDQLGRVGEFPLDSGVSFSEYAANGAAPVPAEALAGEEPPLREG